MEKFLKTLQNIENIVRLLRHKEKTLKYTDKKYKLPKGAMAEAEIIMDALGRLVILLTEGRDAIGNRKNPTK